MFRQATHKVKLISGRGYKEGSWIKVIPADNLPYDNHYWNVNCEFFREHPVGMLVGPDDFTSIKVYQEKEYK